MTLIITDAVRSLLALAALASAFAQEPAAAPANLVYTGEPLQLASHCERSTLNMLGLQCSAEEPCPMLLELTAAEAVGTRLIVAGNLHTGAVTTESILLVSEDGGRTWAEPASRVGFASFDRIQFFDFESGWISGHTLLALPRDPFFMITRDGGRSWRRRPVWSESRPGVIESFRFRSKTEGLMAIDRLQAAGEGGRYEIYETVAAGDAWNLREVTPKSPLAHAAAATSLRLTTDAKSKSYLVERQGPTGPQVLARFAIAAGECRASARELDSQPDLTELDEAAPPK